MVPDYEHPSRFIRMDDGVMAGNEGFIGHRVIPLKVPPGPEMVRGALSFFCTSCSGGLSDQFTVIVIILDTMAGGFCWSLSCSVKVNVPFTLGVPLRVPLRVLKAIPDGSDPSITPQA